MNILLCCLLFMYKKKERHNYEIDTFGQFEEDGRIVVFCKGANEVVIANRNYILEFVFYCFLFLCYTEFMDVCL